MVVAREAAGRVAVARKAAGRVVVAGGAVARAAAEVPRKALMEVEPDESSLAVKATELGGVTRARAALAKQASGELKLAEVVG